MTTIQGGSAIFRAGHGDDAGSAGCLAAFPDLPDRLFLLTAGHVLVGTAARQLDPVQAEDLPGRLLGVLFGWTDVMTGPTTVDAAIVQVDPSLVRPDLGPNGPAAGVNDAPQVGMTLTCVTEAGTRTGKILGLGVSRLIAMAGPDFTHPVDYTGQILCESLSTEGSSGAMALDDQNRIVGMVVAGDDRSFTLVTPIKAILEHPDWQGHVLEPAVTIPASARASTVPPPVPAPPPIRRPAPVVRAPGRAPARSMYVHKLATVLDKERGVTGMVAKAQRAGLTSIWVKVADHEEPYDNTLGALGASLQDLVAQSHQVGIQVWGWHVPACGTPAAAAAEAKAFGDVAKNFRLDGLIMDAEAHPESGFFAGDVAAAAAYAAAMRAIADGQNVPLAISSHDVPSGQSDATGEWSPKFTQIARRCDFNFPQTYYGTSPSVADRIDKAAGDPPNRALTIPFVPVGAAFLKVDEGGCRSESDCAARARTFIQLCRDRSYQGYSFWLWDDAPQAVWEVLAAVPA